MGFPAPTHICRRNFPARPIIRLFALPAKRGCVKSKSAIRVRRLRAPMALLPTPRFLTVKRASIFRLPTRSRRHFRARAFRSTPAQPQAKPAGQTPTQNPVSLLWHPVFLLPGFHQSFSSTNWKFLSPSPCIDSFVNIVRMRQKPACQHCVSWWSLLWRPRSWVVRLPVSFHHCSHGFSNPCAADSSSSTLNNEHT